VKIKGVRYKQPMKKEGLFAQRRFAGKKNLKGKKIRISRHRITRSKKEIKFRTGGGGKRGGERSVWQKKMSNNGGPTYSGERSGGGSPIFVLKKKREKTRN